MRTDRHLSVKGSPGHTVAVAGILNTHSLAVRHESKRVATSFYQMMMGHTVSR
jgi:hypothetical protein